MVYPFGESKKGYQTQLQPKRLHPKRLHPKRLHPKQVHPKQVQYPKWIYLGTKPSIKKTFFWGNLLCAFLVRTYEGHQVVSPLYPCSPQLNTKQGNGNQETGPKQKQKQGQCHCTFEKAVVRKNHQHSCHLIL